MTPYVVAAVQLLTCVWLFATQWTAACQASQTHVHWISDAIQSSHSLAPPSPPMKWLFNQVAEVLVLQLQHQSFQWIFWFDFHAVQGTLKSLLHHYSLKASILWRSPFFMVQLSLPYMTTGKTIALTRPTFVSKVISQLLNMLSIAFLPRSKCLLILWLQSLSSVILETKKIKSDTVSTFSPWSDGTRCHDLPFWILSFKPTFSLSSFTFIKRLFSSSSLSAIRVVSSAYLRLSILLPATLIPLCDSSSLAFPMMYSA